MSPGHDFDVVAGPRDEAVAACHAKGSITCLMRHVPCTRPEPGSDQYTRLVHVFEIAAGARLKRWHKGATTLRALLGEECPADRLRFVAERVCVPAGAYLDLDDLRILETLMAALVAWECICWPLPVEAVRRGCARALGMTPMDDQGDERHG
jgi:hypothetical protein